MGEGPGLALELQTHSLWMEEFLILALSVESAQNILYVSIIYLCIWNHSKIHGLM